MLQRIFGAVAIFGLCLGVTLAEEFKGKITKIEGNKITIGKKGEADKELDLAAKVKVTKVDADGNKTEVDVKDLKVGEKGIGGATLTTNADNKVTDITITAKKKKV